MWTIKDVKTGSWVNNTGPWAALGTGSSGTGTTAFTKSGGTPAQGKNFVMLFEADPQTQNTGNNLAVGFANADLTNTATPYNFNDITQPISLKLFTGEKDPAAVISTTTATFTTAFNFSSAALVIWGN